MSLYSLENLKKTYGSRTVLDVPKLELEAGRSYGLMGPNGAGKTTLLEILCFLKRPTSGNLSFDGEPVSYTGPNLTRLRRQVVLVPQSPILFTTSVRKNVEYGLKVRNISTKERRRKAEESLETVGMSDFAEARADRLSGGETQRVAIARALACMPHVVFMDEPTANVDVENQGVIERIINDIRQKGISVVFTSHDMNQAARLADEVMFLFQGKLAQSPFENIFPAVVSGDNGTLVCRLSEAVAVPISGVRSGPVRVNIDPRLIRIEPCFEPSDYQRELAGRIQQVSGEGDSVRVLVDLGFRLNVLITSGEYEDHPFHVGQQVLVKELAKAIRIL